eukprot:6187264-Pleurochrysis_carterae.AAC.4
MHEKGRLQLGSLVRACCYNPCVVLQRLRTSPFVVDASRISEVRAMQGRSSCRREFMRNASACEKLLQVVEATHGAFI